jgi:hypothetical protein
MLVLLPHHEPSDVLQEDQRHLPLATQLHEVRPLLSTLAKQDAVVGHDSNLLVVDPTKTSHQCRPVLLLVLLELGAVEDPGKDRTGVEGLLEIRGNDVVELLGIVERLLDVGEIEIDLRGIELNPSKSTLAAMFLPIQSACSSFSARWSDTPEILV